MALRTLRIFISSPGDVAEERLIARRVIGRLDAQLAGAVRLEPIFWEGAALVATASFQEQLFRPRDADIVLCILWSRLGTVLPQHLRRSDGTAYASGTEFEFEDAQTGFVETGHPAIMVYRKTASAALPAEPRLLNDYLQQRQALDGFIAKWFINAEDGSLHRAFHAFDSPADFEDLFEAHLAQLIEPFLPPGTAGRSGAAAWREGSPFRGLEPFEPRHSAVFFGRTAAVAAVLMKLRRQAEAHKRFVLVVAMSGGGKSSLVRAGVLPLLTQPGVVSAATHWQQVILRPTDALGDLPGALARALGVAAGQAPAALAQAVCQRLDEPAGERHDMVLVIDQMEEAFTDERIDAAQRSAFAAQLDALARCGRVWVLGTLRSDVYPRLMELPALMALKEGDGQFDLLPPGPREIGQIIRLPAAAAGLRFEVRANTAERLDDLIRDAAAKNPGALPLLQFLLEELYKRRNAEDVLTFRAYEELGGVEGALAQRAETVMQEVSEPAQQALPLVLRELVTYGNAGDDDAKVMRRVAPRGAFEGDASNELVDALLQARLLVSTLGEDGQPAISLAHEALLEFWPRLREWQEQNRELIHVHARVAAMAKTWERQGRSGDFLLPRGKPLLEAVGLVAAGLRLSPSEQALVRASSRRAQQFKWLRAGGIAALGVTSLVATGAAWRATQESHRAQVQATTAQRTSDFMVSLFAVADPNESRGEKVTVREILDRGVGEIQTGLDGEPRVRANLMRSMGQAYNGLGLYPKAKGLLEQALSQAEQNGAAPEILLARLALAGNRYVDGDYARAEALFRTAHQEATTLHGERHPLTTASMVGLADSLAELDRNPEAETLYRQALAIDLRLHGETHADTARSLNALAGWLYFQSRLDEAQPLFERALAVRRTLFGNRHAAVGQGLSHLGSLHYQRGQLEQAANAWNETLTVYHSVFGAEHREVATVLNNLGRAELMRGRYAQAELHFEHALAMDRKLLAPGHDDLVLPLNSLAMALMARGEWPRAQQLLDEALPLAQAKRHWLLNQVQASLGELALAQGQDAPAQSRLTQARETLQAQYGDKLRGAEAWRVAVLDGLEAGLLLRSHQEADAERLLIQALPLIQARFGPRGYYADQLLNRLLALYTATAQTVQAEKYKAMLKSR